MSTLFPFFQSISISPFSALTLLGRALSFFSLVLLNRSPFDTQYLSTLYSASLVGYSVYLAMPSSNTYVVPPPYFHYTISPLPLGLKP
jgi:hypothetical protein